MCGIVGALGSGVSELSLRNQLAHLSRRGPDHQEIIEIQPDLYFGSTRLAMVDPLPRSNQPFKDLESGDVLSFNGEIYNYLEIKKTLIKQGIKFTTESDTEVLLKFLQKFGSDSLEKLNGMYAFAFFDSRHNTITLARDELGKKPLYYFKDSSKFIWSSSLVSVVELAGASSLSQHENYEYLTLGYYLDPSTPFKGINQVLPSEVIKISLSNLKQLHSNVSSKVASSNGSEKNLRESLKTAVKTRSEGHQTVAISLSGGVDSVIIAILAAELDLQCETYSAHWSDSDKTRYNTDSQLAQGISKKLGFNHHQVEMLKTHELINELDKFLAAMEEPNSNPSGVSMMKLYDEIQKDGHRLVLTGDGADEIFSGYSRYELASRIPNFLNIQNERYQKIVLSRRNNSNGKLLGAMASQLHPETPAAWLYWHAIFTPSELVRLSPNTMSEKSLFSEFSAKFKALTPTSIATNAASILMSQDFQIWLPMESNRRLDRISMYHSIEARSPFQDRNVVGAARKLMSESKYQILEKKLLRDAFPELQKLGVREDKAGFISPLGHWLRGNPELIRSTVNYLENELGWNTLELLKLANSPKTGNFRNLTQLWNLIVFVRWACR